MLWSLISNHGPLVNERMVIEWQDTVTVPDPNVNYSYYADFCIEDYNNVPFRKRIRLIHARTSAPEISAI